jgi:chromosome segregation ATPase
VLELAKRFALALVNIARRNIRNCGCEGVSFQKVSVFEASLANFKMSDELSPESRRVPLLAWQTNTSFHQKPQDTEVEIELLQSKLKTAQAELASLRQVNKIQEERISELELEIEGYKIRIAKLEQIVSEGSDKIVRLEESSRKATQQTKHHKAEIDELKARQESTELHIAELEEEAFRTRAQLKSGGQDRAKLQASNANLQHQLTESLKSNQIRTISAIIDELESKIFKSLGDEAESFRFVSDILNSSSPAKQQLDQLVKQKSLTLRPTHVGAIRRLKEERIKHAHSNVAGPNFPPSKDEAMEMVRAAVSQKDQLAIAEMVQSFYNLQ